MGGIGLDLNISPISGQNAKPPMELHKAVWDFVFNYLSDTITDEETSEILEEYTSDEAADHYCDEEWEATDKDLSYYFMDAAGNCYMEMELSNHWLSRALWLNQDSIRELAGIYGYSVDFTDIEALANDKSVLFFQYNDQFCSMYLEPDEEDGLTLTSYGDDRFFYNEMSASEKAYIDNIINNKRCSCGLCQS